MTKTPRIRLIIIVYWFLLTYVIAALVWWFIALQKQNDKMATLLLNEISNSTKDSPLRILQIENEKQRKTAQYIGEGFTFLALILIGAVFVYRATRRQLRLSMQQQNFMMAVTHELKTPIAVARLNIETLQKRKLEEDQRQKIIGITLQEVNRLNTLCNNILLASQLDAGNYKSIKGEVDLSSLATKVIRDFKQRYTDREITGNIEGDIIVMSEELLLELLMSNLIENAVKYSPKESPVQVRLIAKEDLIKLSVSDKGPGIATQEKEKVFEKFYRIGNEETRTAKGTGLGLYLCRQIAKDHNAIITLKDNENKGSIFTVTFKKQL